MYIFMKTSLEQRGRNNGVAENTLRALPGQIFPDGTPVDTTLNIQSPKDPVYYGGGTRTEYPIGTVFGCDHLELVKTKNLTSFYSVYDESKGQSGTNPGALRFHPVSDDPTFQFLSPDHKDTDMNNEYIHWSMTGGTAPAAASKPRKSPKKTKSAAASPVLCLACIRPHDSNGKARIPADGWKEHYPGQLAAEGEVIKNWFKRQLKTLGIRPSINPAMNAMAKSALETLYSAGETVNSLVSGARLNAVIAAEKADATGLSIHSKGPFQWYLDLLVKEHKEAQTCTAVARRHDEPEHVTEAAYVICVSHNARTGSINLPDTPDALAYTGKALEAGWSLNEMILPENLARNDDFEDYLQAIADGSIPLPERPAESETSLVDEMMTDPCLACPKPEEGFFVNPSDWKKLVRNLKRKTNTLLVGPSGTGKTQLIQKLCEKTGIPCTVIQMGAVTDPTEHLVGKDTLAAGGTEVEYVLSKFAQAIQHEGVIILDEINRCPRNGTNLLFSCLDGTRMLPGNHGEAIPVHPECVFFATANIGVEYTGVGQIDRALQTRFMLLKTRYLTIDQEKEVLKVRGGISEADAYNIAYVANMIRRMAAKQELENSVSMRETLLCAEYIRDGFSFEEAIEACFYPLFDEGEEIWGAVDVNSEIHKVRTIVDGLTRKNS